MQNTHVNDDAILRLTYVVNVFNNTITCFLLDMVFW